MTNPHDKAIEAAAEALLAAEWEAAGAMPEDAAMIARAIMGGISDDSADDARVARLAARAAIAAYERAMWRPIEEAPKDGTPIQVTHLPFTGRPPFNAVRWSHGPQKSQWRWRILGYERSPLRYTPTHFRPLPKPEGI